MKTLSIIFATALLAGCAGMGHMGDSSGAHGVAGDRYSDNPAGYQADPNNSIYFGD